MDSLLTVLTLLPDEKRKWARIEAEYSLTWLPVVASAVKAVSTVTTQDDSDFVITKITAYATTTAATPVESTAPPLTISLSVGANSLMPDGNDVHIGTYITNATKQGGKALQFPVYVAKQTSLKGLLTNLDTANGYNVRLSFEGIRIFNGVLNSSGL